MNTLLIILAILLAIVGILGSIIPGLPGPPLSWAALIVLHFSDQVQFTPLLLILMAIIAIIITVLDYIVPSISTKRHGGSRAGVWGCNIGLVISILGLPFGPQGLLGVIFWPFVGALVGELISGKSLTPAFNAAWGAFLGFLTGTGLKLIYGVVASIFIIKELLF